MRKQQLSTGWCTLCGSGLVVLLQCFQFSKPNFVLFALQNAKILHGVEEALTWPAGLFGVDKSSAERSFSVIVLVVQFVEDAAEWIAAPSCRERR
jgi:hypothetical protein